jgi:hypothetical protein
MKRNAIREAVFNWLASLPDPIKSSPQDFWKSSFDPTDGKTAYGTVCRYKTEWLRANGLRTTEPLRVKWWQKPLMDAQAPDFESILSRSHLSDNERQLVRLLCQIDLEPMLSRLWTNSDTFELARLVNEVLGELYDGTREGGPGQIEKLSADVAAIKCPSCPLVARRLQRTRD